MSDINSRHHKEPEKTSKPVWVIGVVLGCVITILFVVFLVNKGSQSFFQTPAEKQALLEIEFKTIVPLQNADLTRYYVTNKPIQALVHADYLSKASSAEIFAHYDEQLKQHGWQLVETKKITVNDKDLGGSLSQYCKGEYGAEIYYAGRQAPTQLTYVVDLSWGIDTYDCEN